MPRLHNHIDRREMERRLLESNEPRTTISFYKYFKIEDPQAFRDELYLNLDAIGVLGRIYVAAEGINAQISVPTKNLDAFKNVFRKDPFTPLDGIRLNFAVDDDGKSFATLRIKNRHRIVADGLPDGLIDPSDSATYLKANEFNQLVDSKEVILIDMRNTYEYEVGHFENAQLVDADTFRDQLPLAVEQFQDAKDKTIVMYCTGGIRCEKASAYFKHAGFNDVYHLEGGIIEYSRKAKELGIPNKFIGKNFVFDRRMAERISEDVIGKCHQCGKPCDTHVNCANQACHSLFIQCDECAEKYEACCTDKCKEFTHLPKEEQKARAHEFRRSTPGKPYLKRRIVEQD